VPSADQSASGGLNMANLGLIFAQTRNGVIGRAGHMPWHLPEDLAHFKRVTIGQPVIMGRKTWDSIPARFRPLPGRDTWVITRQLEWHATGALVAHSLPEALQNMPPQATPWVMGGGEIYAQALPWANRAVVTEIDLVVQDGDTFAPTLGPEWVEQSRESHISGTGLAFNVVHWKKLN